MPNRHYYDRYVWPEDISGEYFNDLSQIIRRHLRKLDYHIYMSRTIKNEMRIYWERSWIAVLYYGDDASVLVRNPHGSQPIDFHNPDSFTILEAYLEKCKTSNVVWANHW